jgi:hypothetical protein
MPPALARHVTLRELSELYGWSTSRAAVRRLRKRLLDRQRLTQEPFIAKLGTGPNSPLLTTVPLIRKHCPEMVDRPAEALDMVADVMNRLKSDMAELRRENQALRHRVKVLEATRSSHVCTA